MTWRCSAARALVSFSRVTASEAGPSVEEVCACWLSSLLVLFAWPRVGRLCRMISSSLGGVCPSPDPTAASDLSSHSSSKACGTRSPFPALVLLAALSTGLRGPARCRAAPVAGFSPLYAGLPLHPHPLARQRFPLLHDVLVLSCSTPPLLPHL